MLALSGRWTLLVVVQASREGKIPSAGSLVICVIRVCWVKFPATTRHISVRVPLSLVLKEIWHLSRPPFGVCCAKELMSMVI